MPASHSPQYCLARAEQCEDMAWKAAFEPTRQTFLRLAEKWRALATQGFDSAEQAEVQLT